MRNEFEQSLKVEVLAQAALKELAQSMRFDARRRTEKEVFDVSTPLEIRAPIKLIDTPFNGT
jgi:hypothetical protein